MNYFCIECDDEGLLCLGCGMPASKCTAVSTGCIRNEGRDQQENECDEPGCIAGQREMRKR